MTPIPILRELTPEPAIVPPEGFQSLDVYLTGTIPHAIRLENDIQASLILPNGLANTWRNIDPDTVVSSDLGERSSVPAMSAWDDATAGVVARVPLRLLIRIDNVVRASLPLIANKRYKIFENGGQDLGVLLELLVLTWNIKSGNLRGSGDFGSRIKLAWRRVDRGLREFSSTPTDPYLSLRLRDEEKFLSYDQDLLEHP